MYQFPLFPDAVPRELLPGRVWVCCDREKVPLVASRRGPSEVATSTDPSTWRTFEEALAAYKAGRYCGIGRVFEKGAGIVGVDIDHCRDSHTGRITTYGHEILDTLDSYSEVSPSGTGVKVWVYADIPASKVKAGLEIYRQARYFTVTGQILPQYRSILTERTEALLEIIAREFPKRERRRHPSASYDGPRLNLEEVLDGGGVDVLAEISDAGAERKYRVLCPWIEEHTTNPDSGTYAGQYPSGALFFQCWHSHCQHRRWRDFINYLRWVKSWRVNLPGYTGGPLEVTNNA